MARLTGCCGCFDLREGSRAIGITQLVLGGLGLVSEIVGTVLLTQQHNFRMTFEAVVQIAFQLVACILHLIFNSLLVYGVNKSSRGMIMAWIIYSGFINALQTAFVAGVFLFACILGIWWLILLVLGIAGLICIFWYWFRVVSHYYQEMREQDGKRQNERL